MDSGAKLSGFLFCLCHLGVYNSVISLRLCFFICKMKIIIAPTDRVLVRIKYGLEQSLEWSRGRKSYRVGSGLGKHLLVNESFIYFFPSRL